MSPLKEARQCVSPLPGASSPLQKVIQQASVAPFSPSTSDRGTFNVFPACSRALFAVWFACQCFSFHALKNLIAALDESFAGGFKVLVSSRFATSSALAANMFLYIFQSQRERETERESHPETLDVILHYPGGSSPVPRKEKFQVHPLT